MRKMPHPLNKVEASFYWWFFGLLKMLNKKVLKEKTYNRCLYCDARGSFCYGPRTSDMPIERWREFMRDMKEVEGLTYAQISARTAEIGVPVPAKTIEKKLSPGGDGQDVMREIARAIEIAILGTAPYPCYMAFHDGNPEKEKQSMARDAEIARLKNDLDTLRAESQKKIDHLLSENERKNRIIDKLLDR